MSEKLVETIELRIESPKAAVEGGLGAMVRQLESALGYVRALNAELSGMKAPVGALRSIKELQAEIKRLQGKGMGLDVESLSKGLNLDPAMLRRHLAQLKSGLKDAYKVSTEEFSSANKAGSIIGGILRKENRAAAAAQKGLANLLTPAVSQVNPGAISGSAVSAAVHGAISLVIPASQIQASVIGQVNVGVPAAGGGGGGQAKGPDGRFLPGGGGGGGGGKKGGKKTGQGLSQPQSVNELSRVVTETEKSWQETITAAGKFGEEISKTYNDVGDVLKTVTRQKGGTALRQKIQNARSLEAEAFKRSKAGLSKGDFQGLAALYEKQAAQLEGILTPDVQKALSGKNLQSLQQKVQAQSATLRAQAQQIRNTGFQKNQQAYEAWWSAQLKQQQAQIQAGLTGQSGVQKYFQTIQQAQQRQQQHAARQQAYMNQVRGRQRQVMNAARAANSLTAGPGGGGLLNRLPSGRGALSGFSPMGFVTNLAKVTAWTTAVGALYKTLQLAEYSMGRLIDVGLQTARLEQVFRGTADEAHHLADEVMRSAAAEGRSTQEAMDSAIAWSRLGYTRTQVNEAVRVSLMAANVAEMDAGEATKHLSALTAVYHFRVDELEGVLGQLNNTSNKYNVTNNDLLVGLSRSAAVAQQAGIGFSELQGIIGAAVGRTGQTGANIGNAMKSIVVALGKPEIQEFLREGFNLESTTGDGSEMKSMSQRLRELFVAYQGMTEVERENLTVRVAGKTQASRFVAILDSYITAEKLAIDAQLNLNSAQAENAKILATQKAALGQLRSEWDRFVVSKGGGLSEDLATLEKTLANILNLGSRVGVKNINQFLAPSASSLIGIMDTFNRWMEGPLAGKLQSLQSQANQAGSAASGYNDLSQFFRTGASALDTAINQERRDAIAQQIADTGLLNDAQSQQLLTLVKQNELVQARALLEAAAADAAKKSAEQRKQEAEAMRNQIASVEAALKKAQAESNKTPGNEEQIKELKRQLAEARNQVAKSTILPEEEPSADSESLTQNLRNRLAQVKGLMNSFSELTSQFPAEGASGKLQQHVGLLQQQMELLDSAFKDINAMPNSTEASRQLEEMLRNVRSELAFAQSPEAGAMARLLDQRAVAARAARGEAKSFFVGSTESEKLLTGENQLQEELRKLQRTESARSLTENERVRQVEFEIQLSRTQEQIQSRILNLKQQEKQVMADANREFQRSLLFAGPGELLNKLTASTLHRQGKINMGSFFALSPEIRREIDLLRGGDAGSRLRLEQRQMAGHERTVPQQQSDAVFGSHQISQAQAGLNRNNQIPLMIGEELRARVQSAIAIGQWNAQLMSGARVTGQFIGALNEAIRVLNAVKVIPLTPHQGPSLPAASGRALGE